MTFLDRLKAEHPDCVRKDERAGDYCPCAFNYESNNDCDRDSTRPNCVSCWNREMPVQRDVANTDALKYDHGKLRLDLIPTTAYNSLGAVLTYGAKKYADNTWQGVERERYIAALLRHMVAYLDDPQGKDEESGLLHSEHLLCNAMFLNHFACKENEIGGE